MGSGLVVPFPRTCAFLWDILERPKPPKAPRDGTPGINQVAGQEDSLGLGISRELNSPQGHWSASSWSGSNLWLQTFLQSTMAPTKDLKGLHGNSGVGWAGPPTLKISTKSIP